MYAEKIEDLQNEVAQEIYQDSLTMRQLLAQQVQRLSLAETTMTPKQQEKAFQRITVNLSTIDYIDERLTRFKNAYLQLRDLGERPKTIAEEDLKEQQINEQPKPT